MFKNRFWEIFPGCVSWTTLFGLFFLSWKFPAFVVVFIVLFDLYWFLKTVYLFFHLRYSFSILRRNLTINWLKKLDSEKKGSFEKIWHLVILPMYKEPYEVVRSSVESISKTNYDKRKIILALAVEERGGEDDKKTAELVKSEFKDSFAEFFVTFHPKDIPGELPGKGSNETWAAKHAKIEIIDKLNIPYEKILVSVFDVDSRPGKEYFGVLTYSFLNARNPENSSYQPIPLFTNNFYDVSAFSKLIGFSATFWQLMQQSRPEQLVTFSSHSMPFSALNEIGYWHTDIVSEDSRIFFQCLLHNKGNWNVVPLFYPIYMDAVSGGGFFESMKNLYKQQRRWAWGVENFAYIMKEFIRLKKEIPLRLKAHWILYTFDGFYSWATSSFIIFLFGWLPNLIGSDAFRTTLFSYNLPKITGWLINLSSIGIITSALLSIVFIPPKPSGIKIWNYILYIFQWFLMPFTFIIFGSIPALEAQTRLMLGGKFRLGFWKTPKS